MKRMGSILFILLAILVTACNKETKIEGTALIGSIGNSNDTLYFYGTDRFYDKKDTIISNNGEFIHPLNVDTTIIGYIYSNNFEETRVFIGPNEQLQIGLSPTDSTKLEITGNQMHADYAQFKAELEHSTDTLESIKAYIAKNPFSITSIAAIEDYLVFDANPNYSFIEEAIKELPGILSDRQAIEAINSKLPMAQRAGVDRTLLFFNLPDLKKKFHDRKDFKDKLLILYFWASWDAKSKELNKELRQLQKKYKKHKKDLAIVGISLDTDTVQLKETIKADSIDWTILSDRTTWDSQVVDRYGVVQLPTIILANKKDLILARDVSLDSIQTLINKELKIK